MTFFAILLIILLLGWLLARLSPYLLVRWMKKNTSAPGAGRRSEQREEGDVFISRKEQREDKVVDRDMGEYVDYEELDENGKK